MRQNVIFSAFFALIILVMSLGFFIFIGVWIFFRRLLGGSEEEAPVPNPVQRVSRFGAPAPPWWIETYERLLWVLEDITHINFNGSPESLFTGALILGSFTGFIAGQLAYWLIGWSFWQVFFAILLLNVFSAWLLTRPARGWWELNNSREGMANPLGSRGGFILGRRIDE